MSKFEFGDVLWLDDGTNFVVTSWMLRYDVDEILEGAKIETVIRNKEIIYDTRFGDETNE